MALPTSLTPIQAGGAFGTDETVVVFNTGPNRGKALLVSRTDPNILASVNDGSISMPLPHPVAPPPPANTAPPAITGTAQVGQTLTVSNGTWTGSPTFARQWLANGTNIGGATQTTYVPVVGNIDQVITCRVTATNAGGSLPITSAPTAAVIAAA